MGTLANSILLRNLFFWSICDRLEGRSSPEIRGLSSDLLRSKRAEIKMNPLFYWVILPIYNSASYIFVEFYFKKKCMFFTCYLWSWWKSNFLPFRWSGALVVPAGRQGQPLLWKSAYTDIIKCNTVIFKQLQTCSCQLQNCSGARTASFPHVHQNSCSCSETFFFSISSLGWVPGWVQTKSAIKADWETETNSTNCAGMMESPWGAWEKTHHP